MGWLSGRVRDLGATGWETDGGAVSGMQLDGARDAANVQCGELGGGKARGREWAGAREGVERELAVTTRDGEGEEVADGAAGRRDTDTNKHARIRRRRTECARWWSYHRALGWPRWDCMQWVDRGLQLMLVPAGAG